MKKSKILQVAVDETTEAAVRKQADKEDVPLSALIRRAINKYLSAKGKAA